jgi:hypothetical protein
MFFYDIDCIDLQHLLNTQVEIMKSLMQIDDVWIRLSSSGLGIHIISRTGLQPIVSPYLDNRYAGLVFFNNKGDKWAEAMWTHTKTGKKKFFRPTLCVCYIESDIIGQQKQTTQLLAPKIPFNTFSWYFFASIIVNWDDVGLPITMPLQRSRHDTTFLSYLPFASQNQYNLLTNRMNYSIIYDDFINSIHWEHKIENHIDELTETDQMPKIGNILL